VFVWKNAMFESSKCEKFLYGSEYASTIALHELSFTIMISQGLYRPVSGVDTGVCMEKRHVSSNGVATPHSQPNARAHREMVVFANTDCSQT
jgi:hypothetical protein